MVFWFKSTIHELTQLKVNKIRKAEINAAHIAYISIIFYFRNDIQSNWSILHYAKYNNNFIYRHNTFKIVQGKQEFHHSLIIIFQYIPCIIFYTIYQNCINWIMSIPIISSNFTASLDLLQFYALDGWLILNMAEIHGIIILAICIVI